MRERLKTVLIFLICALLPWPLRRLALSSLFGWRLHRRSRIALSLFYNVESVKLGPGASTGYFNVFRNLRLLELGDNSSIGQWNWITCSPMFFDPPVAGTGTLVVEQETAVTSRHYIDCAGGIRIGAHTTVAGVRSTILTHQIETEASRQTALPVSIGSHCLLGSNVCVTPGASIPDNSVVAMGAVVVGALGEPGMLYAGVPARPVRSVEAGEYFHRERGFVER
jgi:acetyltransferase-like isoleucine patch superfamily enzyme